MKQNKIQNVEENLKEESLLKAAEETLKDRDGAFLIFLKIIMVMLLLATFYLFEWGVEMVAFALVYSDIYIKGITVLLSSFLTLGTSYLINLIYIKNNGSDPVLLKSFIIWTVSIVILGTLMGFSIGVGV